jgi:hypothetical protein
MVAQRHNIRARLKKPPRLFGVNPHNISVLAVYNANFRVIEFFYAAQLFSGDP